MKFTSKKENKHVIKPVKSKLPKKETENIFSKPPITGEKIQLSHIYFEQGKAILIPGSNKELDELVKYLKKYFSIRIRLEGHTDAIGNPDKNLLLSESRVLLVKQYLVNHGIQDTRIECKGYGSTKPLNTSTEESGRKLNRRVEVVILSQ